MAQPNSSGTSGSGEYPTGRAVLDAPPPSGRLRNDPSSQRSPVRGSKLASLARENTAEGEFEEQDADGASELDQHPVVQAFDYYQQARGYLQLLSTKMPPVGMLVTDFITTLDQLVPQAGAAMLSGGAMGMMGSAGPQSQLGALGAGSPAGVPQPAPMAGAPTMPPGAQAPPMGLGALAGVGAGMGMV